MEDVVFQSFVRPYDVIICDIDGTIADNTHRKHHLEKTPKDWVSFNAGIMLDTPILHMRKLLRWMLQGHDGLVYCTGRNEEMREQTCQWMMVSQFPFGRAMYFRPENDYRPDEIVKFEMLQKIRADGFNPVVAFDDRDKVVAMWRENGVPCMQVAPGNF